jgi:hypothetical protein
MMTTTMTSLLARRPRGKWRKRRRARRRKKKKKEEEEIMCHQLHQLRQALVACQETFRTSLTFPAFRGQYPTCKT